MCVCVFVCVCQRSNISHLHVFISTKQKSNYPCVFSLAQCRLTTTPKTRRPKWAKKRATTATTAIRKREVDGCCRSFASLSYIEWIWISVFVWWYFCIFVSFFQNFCFLYFFWHRWNLHSCCVFWTLLWYFFILYFFWHSWNLLSYCVFPIPLWCIYPSVFVNMYFLTLCLYQVSIMCHDTFKIFASHNLPTWDCYVTSTWHYWQALHSRSKGVFLWNLLNVTRCHSFIDWCKPCFPIFSLTAANVHS